LGSIKKNLRGENKEIGEEKEKLVDFNDCSSVQIEEEKKKKQQKMAERFFFLNKFKLKKRHYKITMDSADPVLKNRELFLWWLDLW